MTVHSGMRVRVWVEDVWDDVVLDVTPAWTVARLKAETLSAALGNAPRLESYHVKFRGALVLDEGVSLGQLGVPDNAPFIIVSARRRPVR